MVLNFKKYLYESRESEMILPEYVEKIADIYHKNGRSLYVVGGAVRDHLLNKTPKDFDLATDATPDESIDMLSPYYKVLEVGKAFGVIKVMVPEDPEGVEIATFREESYKDSRRPDTVRYSSIDKDVMRRDLTVNALFYDIKGKRIVDLVNGIDDIEKGVIRTVGSSAERFAEDPLRKLRAVRFASKLGSKIDQETHQSLAKDPIFHNISVERVRDEFLKILSSAKNVREAISLLESYGMLTQVFPGFKLDTDLLSESFTIVTVALMLRNNPIEKIESGLNKLAWTSEEIAKITFLIRLVTLSPDNAYEMKKRMKVIKFYYLEEILDFCRIAGIDSKLIDSFLKYEPSVSTQELMDLGFKGPDLGREIKKREAEEFQKILDSK
jgi:tRNA nucleotidyltransferase/poly(A) polymerase